MSYDLMVFRPDVAPRTRPEFMDWYSEQTQWTEEHSYDDPSITSDDLQSWFIEMIEFYPAMNGPYAKEENEDNEFVTDYSIGKNVIYAGFSWSLAEQAYEKMKTLAEKHKVGFLDASADDGDILFPDDDGQNKPIDRTNNVSSIQQIKNSATAGQENMGVKEILFSKLNLQAIAEQTAVDSSIKTPGKRSWRKRLLGLK
jgi:hypothetical protein